MGHFNRISTRSTSRSYRTSLPIADSFVGADAVAVMMGDNIFFSRDAFPNSMAKFQSGATIFAYQLPYPEEYGKVKLGLDGSAVSIEEKPAYPKFPFAVPGLYSYDSSILAIGKMISASSCSELKITDITRENLERGQLFVSRLSRGFALLDAGTSRTLQEASAYVETMERRLGVKLGCPKEATLVRGFFELDQFQSVISRMPDCEYRSYPKRAAFEHQRTVGYNL